MDIIAAGSPEWWLHRLSGKLDMRAAAVAANRNYYRGDHPVPGPPRGTSTEAQREAEKAFHHMCRLGVTNWVKLVADAPAERLEVIGFRFGEALGGDSDAWRIWQANQLDADSGLVHEAALQVGQSFVLVWPSASRAPLITAETASQCIVAYEAGSRRRRVAALKRWQADDGRIMATIYLPDGLCKFESASAADQGGGGWKRRMVAGETWPLPNPMGAVPMVEFRANADLEPAPFGGGESEFAGVLTIQDRINKTIFDRLVTAEFQAFRQRYAIGWEVPTIRDATGADTGQADLAAMARAGASRMLTLPEGTTVGEFSQADFTPFVVAAEADVAAMAAISKTPPHYLLGKMVNISGDALKEAKAGLVAKVRRHSRGFGESWEEVLRLALAATGDPRASDMQSMVLWGDMESRTWGETVDAVLKMQALGVPQEELWLRLPDVTPQDVARWKALNAQKALFAPAPPVAAPVVPVAE